MEEVSMDCTVSGAHALLLRLSRLLGIAPLTFRRVGSDLRVSVSKYASTYVKITAGSMGLIAATLIVIYIRTNIDGKTGSRKFEYLLAVAYLPLMLCILAGHITGKLRMTGTVKCLNQIQQVTMELQDYSQRPTFGSKNWQKTLAVLLKVCIILIDYFRHMAQMDFDGIKREFAVLFVFDFMNIMQLISAALFTFIAEEVCLTLKHLNECLSDLLQESQLVDRVIGVERNLPPRRLNVDTVQHLKLLFMSICDWTADLNRAFGIVHMLSISAAIVNLMMTVYTLLMISFDDVMTFVVCFAFVVRCLRVLIHLSIIMFIIEPSHQTQEEVDNTKYLVSKMMLTYSLHQNSLAQEIDMFCVYIARKKVVYAPMQMFNVTRGLIVTIIGTITTYLIIVINL